MLLAVLMVTISAIGMFCTLQGNCSGLPQPTGSEYNLTGPGLLDLRPNQCLMVMDASHIRLLGKIWLDSLYVRSQRIEGNPSYNALMWTSFDLYMTEVTLQQHKEGGPNCPDCELWFQSNVLAEGMIYCVSQCCIWVCGIGCLMDAHFGSRNSTTTCRLYFLWF